MRLGRQHSPDQPELGHGAVQFTGRFLRIMDGKVRHRLQSRRSFAVIGNKIIVGPAQGSGIGWLADQPDAQTCSRIKHGRVDFLPIHGRQALLQLDTGLAQSPSQAAIVGLAGNIGGSAIAKGLVQMGLDQFIQIPGMTIRIDDLDDVSHFHNKPPV